MGRGGCWAFEGIKGKLALLKGFLECPVVLEIGCADSHLLCTGLIDDDGSEFTIGLNEALEISKGFFGFIYDDIEGWYSEGFLIDRFCRTFLTFRRGV